MSVNTKYLELPVSGAFFWKRVQLEKVAEDFITKVIDISECAKTGGNSDCMESSYNELSDYYYSIIESLEKHSLPFWWGEFINVENELKSLVSQIIIYSNNINFIEQRTPFEEMIEREILILNDIKEFFKVMMFGREGISAVKESILNNEQAFEEILKNASLESENKNSSVLYFTIINIFKRFRKINSNISEALGKIAMGAAV